MQFILIAYDGEDPSAPERRMKVRQEHLDKIDVLKAKGEFLKALPAGWKTMSKNLRLTVSAFILALIVLLTFIKAFDNNFVDWDDFTYVVNNDLVRDTENNGLEDFLKTPVSSNYHPLTMLSLRMNNNDCSSCPDGISPAPFIRWNVILHILNSLLVLVLVYLLTGGRLLVSFIVAAIFGVHPMHVESVAWISERKDVLYSFFFLAGLIAYIKFKTGHERKYICLALAFTAFLLSCLSKGVAVVFPLVMILINYWYDGRVIRVFTIRGMLVLLPFFIVSIFFGLIAYSLQNGQNFLGILDLGPGIPDVVDSAGPFTLWQKVRHGSYGFVAYIIKFFAPVNLSAFYPYPDSPEFSSGLYSSFTAIAPFVMLLISIFVILSIKRTKILAFGMGFYLATIILVLQFLPVGYAIIADRYTYLPYIGLAFILATQADTLAKWRKALLPATGLFLMFLVLTSFRQADVWSNTETLWTNTIEKFPGVEVARRSRAKFYSKAAMITTNTREKSRYQKLALDDFMAAMKSGSKNAEVYEGMGVIYGSNGDHASAMKFFDIAARLDPSNGSVLYNRALTLTSLGRNEEAIVNYNAALKYSPEKELMIRTNRLNLYLSMKMYKEAIPDLDYLIGKNDRNPVHYYNRAVSKLMTNDKEGAIGDFRKVLQLDPNDREVESRLKQLTR